MAVTNQRGYVTTRGKQWYGYYRKVVNDPATNEQKSVRIPVNLGLKSRMNKTEARHALEREITKQLGQTGSPNSNHERRYRDLRLVRDESVHPP